jgi:hypothetical protein
MSKNTFKPFAKVDLIILGALLLIGLVIAHLLYNPAQNAAGPLDSAIISDGGKRICTDSSSGGPDDFIPFYAAVYTTSMPYARAETLVIRAANETGFHIKSYTPQYQHATTNHGWYMDNSSKYSSVPWLGKGPIELNFMLESDGKLVRCPPLGKNSVANDSNHTAIVLSVYMPARKR